jgi:LacI family transcriptional regulator
VTARATPTEPAEPFRATIRDVAREVGVSSSTVSRAMTGGVVSPETRETVLAAAGRLGYRPNRQAQGLVTGRTGSLGLVVPDLRNPFFADVAKGVSARARALRINVFISDTDEDLTAEADSIRSLAGGVDGLLLCSPRLPDGELCPLLGRQQVVLLHREIPGLASVSADLVGGTHQAVAHLRALGHRRIAFIHGPQASWADAQRTVGLPEVTPAVEVVQFGPVAPTPEGGVATADLVLASGATAVIAYNDLVAIGVIHRLAARGVRVPEDFSVVGYDDIAVSALVSPPLTTVHVPKHRAGVAAVDLVLRALDVHSGPEPGNVVLPTHLVVRGSSGPLSAAPAVAAAAAGAGHRPHA